jgi:hypothetical protein
LLTSDDLERCQHLVPIVRTARQRSQGRER